MKGRGTLDCTVRQELTGNRLTDRQVTEFASVSDLYDGQDPRQLQTYETRAEWLEGEFSQHHRERLARTLVRYAETLSAPEESRANAHRLADPRAVALVTGQQAGLFTGPLYSLAKALTVIGVAEQLEKELARPVVPVFWVASEDHDWAEVNHTFILDSELSVRRIRLAMRPELHRMVYHTPLTRDAVESALDEAYLRLPQAEYKTEMMATLRAQWSLEDTLSTWFARTMVQLLGSRGLVLLDPCLPELRTLVGPVFAETLKRNDDVRAELTQCYHAVREAGYVPEVLEDKTNTNVFYVRDGHRYVLQKTSEDMLETRHLSLSKRRAQFIAEALDEATHFSSNVLLRPVIQDHLLPTLAYVGGPSELAYYPLARGIFHAFGRRLPPLLLRQRMNLFPSAVAECLTELGISANDHKGISELVEKHLATAGVDKMQAQVAVLRSLFHEQLEAIATAWPALQPQLSGVLESAKVRHEDQMRGLVNKLSRLVEATEAQQIHRLRSVERWLWTDGHAAERRLSPLNAWSRIGTRALSQLPAWGDYRQVPPVYDISL